MASSADQGNRRRDRRLSLGVDLQAYLTWVFVRRGTHRHKYNLSAAELTPAAYKRSLAS